jgi:hypothetical protein
MFPLRVRVFACALVAAAAVLPVRAAEVPAVPVCGGCCAPATPPCCAPVPTCRVRKCYDPCEPVGPIRRFLRRVFLPPCPRCCPPAPVVGVAPAPAVFVPPSCPAAVAGPPAVDPGRPAPPPPPAPPAPFPGTGSAYRRPPNVLTPPVPPPPIRLDRIASRLGVAE